MAKDETEKFRLTTAEKLAIRKVSAKARISTSALIRLALFSRYNIRTKAAVLRAALGK